ncbi:hypothetical protein CVT26_000480 [Gymnopilus dilepis]|uniref:Uncharacterized protein n=1 Tax=Gymnopilus dilepis TaxID=231916 RepID=A0A409VGX7_9AGAR|nr:hypothetical protein CVT26_000480 [Gymnopilus dilepis]
MAVTPEVLIDDRDLQIRYICFSYSELAAKSYYNTSWTTSVPGDNCSNGIGTGIRVAASILAPSANYSVRLDDADFVPQNGQGSYFSPTLPDGQHTITYALPESDFSLPFLDYLAITPGPSTSLLGHQLAVDDLDTSISFSGDWKDTLPVPLNFNEASPLYLGSAHWSSNVGDSLQFQFQGSSISVYGIAANISEGNITASYTLDGVTTVSSLPAGTIDSVPFVQLYQADIDSGTHTLSVEITHIETPQALGIDLITYAPSFDSITALPSFSNTKHKSLNAGSKAGITVGVLAFAAIVAALLLLLRRRYSRPRNPKFRLYDSFEPGDRKSSFPLQTGNQTFPL